MMILTWNLTWQKNLTKERQNCQKKFDDEFVILTNCDVIVILPICGQFKAIRMVCKASIFVKSNNSNVLSYKNWKQN